MSKIGGKLLRIMLSIFLIFAIISGGVLFVSLKVEYNKLEKHAIEAVKSVSNNVDSNTVQSIIDNKDTESQNYKKLYATLLDAKAYKDLKYIYIFGKKDDKNAYYLMDVSEDSEEIGTEYPFVGGMQDAFKGNFAYDKSPTKDEDGYLISVYAPIKNPSGETIAILGVDTDVTAFQQIRNRLISSFAVVWAISACICVIVCYLFSKQLTKNIKKIQNSLKHMADGDLTNELSIKSGDELEVIGKSIDDFRIRTSGLISGIMEM